MQVICINAKTSSLNTMPQPLIEGKIYTVVGEGSKETWIIEEMIKHDKQFVCAHKFGERLKSRFRVIDTSWIDEALEKALNTEIELAELLN